MPKIFAPASSTRIKAHLRWNGRLLTWMFYLLQKHADVDVGASGRHPNPSKRPRQTARRCSQSLVDRDASFPHLLSFFFSFFERHSIVLLLTGKQKTWPFVLACCPRRRDMDVEQQSRRRAKCGQPPAAMALRPSLF